MFAREVTRLGRGPAAPALPAAVNAPPAVDSLRIPSSAPTGAVDPDRLRRQATEFIETLLAAVGSSSPRREDQAPLLRCVAPVAAGETARATFRIANDGTEASDVSLFCTNFVADTGGDVPSHRVTVSPRRATIAPKGEATFEISLAVPSQTPRGTYSGLLQATGAQYAKAILTVEVT
jgi:hypothetical protein